MTPQAATQSVQTDTKAVANKPIDNKALEGVMKISASMFAGTNTADTSALVNMARMVAMNQLGFKNPADIAKLSEDERTVLNANLNHLATGYIAQLITKSDLAFRQQIWGMIKTGEYTSIRIPVTKRNKPVLDDEGNPMFMVYDNAEAWLDSILSMTNFDRQAKWWMRVLFNQLLPLISTGKVEAHLERTDEDGEILEKIDRPIADEDVMKVGKTNLEIMAGPVSKWIEKMDGSVNDKSLMTLIGNTIDRGSVLTKEELKKFLNSTGGRGGENPLENLEAYRSPTAEGKVVYTIVTSTDRERHFVEGILKSRATDHPVTLEQLTAVLSQLTSVSEEELNADIDITANHDSDNDNDSDQGNTPLD